jgi:halocyanin-like protein
MTTRRTYLATLGAVATSTSALAGCLGGGGSGSSKFDGWLAATGNFDAVTEKTDVDGVTVDVGTKGNNGYNAFAPAAVKVSTGTTVVWEWTGKGRHNVVAKNADFRSNMLTREGETFEHTFDEPGTYKYYCSPHRSLGMKGVVVVE